MKEIEIKINKIVDDIKRKFGFEKLNIVVKYDENLKYNSNIRKGIITNKWYLTFGNYNNAENKMILGEDEIRYILGHELSHIEFKEGRVIYGEVLKLEKERDLKTLFKSILNETMCDIRAAQILDLDNDTIKSYFNKIEDASKDNEFNVNSGYFPYNVRAEIAIKYKRDTKFDEEKFVKIFIEEFEKMKNKKIEYNKIKIVNELISKYYNNYFVIKAQ